MTVVPHLNSGALCTVAAMFCAVFLIHPAAAHDDMGTCTLQDMKDIARSACDHLSDKINNITLVDPFQKRLSDLGRHLTNSGRNRRHTFPGSHQHHHEYHKLNTRFKHGNHGFFEVVLTKQLYHLINVRMDGPKQSVNDWAAELLASKGFDTENSYNRYVVDSSGENDLDFDFVSLRPKRSSVAEESLDSLRHRRTNHAIVAYCCQHVDSARCSDHYCFI